MFIRASKNIQVIHIHAFMSVMNKAVSVKLQSDNSTCIVLLHLFYYVTYAVSEREPRYISKLIIPLLTLPAAPLSADLLCN